VPDPALQIIMVMLITSVIAAYVLLVVGALVSVLRSYQPTGMKMAWIIFIFIAPFIGSILWFLIGKTHTAPRPYHA
jgi:membrane protein DedA with SNARE-associated domain